MSDNGDIVIRVRGLTNRFGSQVVHDGLDLDVRRGEVMGVVGGSGSGKSVLMRSMIGLHKPDSGTVEVLGHNVATMEQRALAKLEARWGVLFQDGALFSALTVSQNIMVPLKEHTRLPRALMGEIVSLKIHMVGLPPDACPKFPSELSGGMRKRAGLARALALDPEILFLDEPTAGLDPIGAAAFDQLISGMQSTLGLTVVMVTHDLDTLNAICDRVAVLVDGRVVVGTLEALMRETHPWIHAYFHGERARAAQPG